MDNLVRLAAGFIAAIERMGDAELGPETRAELLNLASAVKRGTLKTTSTAAREALDMEIIDLNSQEYGKDVL